MILNFFSYYPRNFDSSIANFQTDLQQIYSWMSANLSLNSSKTEFLIIGLKQQLSKMDNYSLNSTHSARNHGFIFYIRWSVSATTSRAYSSLPELLNPNFFHAQVDIK